MFISDHKTLQDIQVEFQAKFPNLKIEFYRKAHEEGQGNPNHEKLDPLLTIGGVRNATASGDLSINGHLKVGTLEQKMEEIYGLHVQVFRKSGSIWLQTTKTDSWTLTEQNNHAMAKGV